MSYQESLDMLLHLASSRLSVLISVLVKLKREMTIHFLLHMHAINESSANA